jgi:hypothetical protein
VTAHDHKFRRFCTSKRASRETLVRQPRYLSVGREQVAKDPSTGRSKAGTLARCELRGVSDRGRRRRLRTVLSAASEAVPSQKSLHEHRGKVPSAVWRDGTKRRCFGGSVCTVAVRERIPSDDCEASWTERKRKVRKRRARAPCSAWPRGIEAPHSLTTAKGSLHDDCNRCAV